MCRKRNEIRLANLQLGAVRSQVDLLYVIVFHLESCTLRKQAYSNILENLPAKYEKFQIKILIVFVCLLKNIDCGYSLEPPRRGGSNKYPQSMF